MKKLPFIKKGHNTDLPSSVKRNDGPDPNSNLISPEPPPHNPSRGFPRPHPPTRPQRPPTGRGSPPTNNALPSPPGRASHFNNPNTLPNPAGRGPPPNRPATAPGGISRRGIHASKPLPPAPATNNHNRPNLPPPVVDRSTIPNQTQNQTPPSLGASTRTNIRGRSGPVNLQKNGFETNNHENTDTSTNDHGTGSEDAIQKKSSDHRNNIVKEILDTEQKYVTHIGNLIDTYMVRLNEIAQIKENNLDKEEIKKMFSNISTIHKFNQELLENIQQRVETWTETSKLGDVFIKYAPFLKLYTDYGNNYKYALERYNHYSANNPLFVQICTECKQECKLNLESLLIMPIQRVPRYNLLISDLLKHTDETHPDYSSLGVALQKMKEVADHINNTVRTTENLKIVAAAGKVLSNVMQAGRVLVKHGELPVICDGKKDKVHFYLFNDLLVYATRAEVKRFGNNFDGNNGLQWPLMLVWLVNITATGFELVGPNKIFQIINCQPDDIQSWVNELQESLKTLLGGPNLNDNWGIRKHKFVFGPDASYDGQWLNGKIHGVGLYYLFGCLYEGGWVNGSKSGRGVMTYNTGDVYDGDWESDKQNGKGSLRYYDGSMYNGEWKSGKKHGQGKFVFANGDTYEGDWDADKAAHNGTLSMVSGVRYSGGWNDGKFHGKGNLACPSGKTYMGDWVAGKQEGQGVMDYGNGERYEGSWRAGKFHGTGTWTTKDSWEVRFSGNWNAGKKEGSGVAHYLDGSSYDGGWKDGKRHGQGVVSYASGDTFTGTWKNGMEQGTGVYKYANAVEIHGKFTKGELEGKCTISRSLGQQEKKDGCVDKITGNCKDSSVSCTINGTNVDLAVVPRQPYFEFCL